MDLANSSKSPQKQKSNLGPLLSRRTPYNWANEAVSATEHFGENTIGNRQTIKRT